ncbi:MAG: regulatory protein GemA [Alphaproteobacteria bacterium]|nr:regulatory protein GemA [Alphaproteobacteria bacterium]
MIERGLQVAIQIGKRQLQLDDETYRALLKRVAGVESSTQLDDTSARAVLDDMRSRGFRDGVNGGSKKRRGGASQPMAKKARALWLALWNLDETETGSEAALTAFAKGITGKDDLRFCTSAELGRVVEGLKAWAKRAGLPMEGGVLSGRRAVVREQWARLHKAGWAKVAGDRGLAGYAHMTWCVPNSRAVDDFETDHFDRVAAKLGPHLRQLKLGRRHRMEAAHG